MPELNATLRGKRAAINVTTDALKREYASGRITDAAYFAGRSYGRVLKRSPRPIGAAGARNPGDKIDHTDGGEAAVASRMEAAGTAVEMGATRRRQLG